MAGVTLAPAFAGAEHLNHQVGKFLGDVQQVALAGGLVVGDGRFDQMPAAVQLVAFGQVLSAVFGMFDGDVGVQVSVLALGQADQFNDFVGDGDVLAAGAVLDAESHRFQPFIKIGVLEDGAAVAALHLPGDNPEIVNAMRGFRAGDAVVEGLPLIGDELLAHQAHITAEKRVGDLHLIGFQRDAVLFHCDAPFCR